MYYLEETSSSGKGKGSKDGKSGSSDKKSSSSEKKGDSSEKKGGSSEKKGGSSEKKDGSSEKKDKSGEKKGGDSGKKVVLIIKTLLQRVSLKMQNTMKSQNTTTDGIILDYYRLEQMHKPKWLYGPYLKPH